MKPELSSDITDILVAWRGGSEKALAELLPLVYLQLREIAGQLLRRERLEHTLETSALVHEAYLRLVDLERIGWKDRAHFFAMSARVMRRVLVDHARYHRRKKRVGNAQRLETSELRHLPAARPPDLIAVDDALQELARHDQQLVQIVELRFFGGLGRNEIAEVMGISSATVTRRWYVARAWLIRHLSQAAS